MYMYVLKFAMSKTIIKPGHESTSRTDRHALDETIWERHLRSDTTGSMNSMDTSLTWRVCLCSLQSHGRSLRVHLIIKRSRSVEYGEMCLSWTAKQDANLLCNASTNDTPHPCGSRCNGWQQHLKSVAETLNTCPSWPCR